ncbi:glycosyltransferase family 2 protein [Lysobacter korlensis]|uniref:Glycosyltransferase family 2 protein n=1 Tax=Lysobacter korlensis TaxID=553636 RepID=A0ABV6RJ12_9GAMM
MSNLAAHSSPGTSPLRLTILMPCLNEAETLAACIAKAQRFLADHGVQGEVLVADNGSTDGSIEIARQLGAQVIHVPIKGYGAALIHGIEAARGAYIVMGDSDESYDFSALAPFLTQLDQGADLVMGNRFRGGIAPGAMPVLHRYLGNPVLTFIGRLFFNVDAGDFHCGLRAFRTESIRRLRLSSRGMEFASEMIVKSAVAGLTIREVPTTLSPDGRSRAPHLRTWRDGWRHLRFLLMYSPRWLFLYPGLLAMALGLVLAVTLASGPARLAPGITLDIHSLIVGCLLTLVGAQATTFAVLARRFAAAQGLLPPKAVLDRLPIFRTLEDSLIPAALLGFAGLTGIAYSLHSWWEAGLGELEFASLARVLILACSAVALAAQLAFSGFLAAIIDTRPGR